MWVEIPLRPPFYAVVVQLDRTLAREAKNLGSNPSDGTNLCSCISGRFERLGM